MALLPAFKRRKKDQWDRSYDSIQIVVDWTANAFHANQLFKNPEHQKTSGTNQTLRGEERILRKLRLLCCSA